MSAPIKVRLPFRFKVHDHNCREIETGPIWLEFDEPPNEGGWDWVGVVEDEATKILIADASASIDWEAKEAKEHGQAKT